MKPRETGGSCDEAQRDRWFVRRSPERPVVRAMKPRETGGSCDEAQRAFIRPSGATDGLFGVGLGRSYVDKWILGLCGYS